MILWENEMQKIPTKYFDDNIAEVRESIDMIVTGCASVNATASNDDFVAIYRLLDKIEAWTTFSEVVVRKRLPVSLDTSEGVFARAGKTGRRLADLLMFMRRNADVYNIHLEERQSPNATKAGNEIAERIVEAYHAADTLKGYYDHVHAKKAMGSEWPTPGQAAPKWAEDKFKEMSDSLADIKKLLEKVDIWLKAKN